MSEEYIQIITPFKKSEVPNFAVLYKIDESFEKLKNEWNKLDKTVTEKVVSIYEQITNIYNQISSERFGKAYKTSFEFTANVNNDNIQTISQELTSLINKAQVYKDNIKKQLEEAKLSIKQSEFKEKVKMLKAISNLEIQYSNIKIVNKSYKDELKSVGIYTAKSFKNLTLKYIVQPIQDACESTIQALSLLNSDSFAERHSPKINKLIKQTTTLLSDNSKHSINSSIDQVYDIAKESTENVFAGIDMDTFIEIREIVESCIPKVEINQVDMQSNKNIKKKLKEINNDIENGITVAIKRVKNKYEKFNTLHEYIAKLCFYVKFTENNDINKFKNISDIFGNASSAMAGVKTAIAGGVSVLLSMPGLIICSIDIFCIAAIFTGGTAILAAIMAASLVLLGIGAALAFYGMHKAKNSTSPLEWGRFV